MSISSGITPLVGSIFAQSPVVLEQHTTVKATAKLMTLQEQNQALNTNFLMTAYGITWLGQAMPGYVTPQGALEPFKPDSEDAELLNATWTARTQLYGTSLKCEAAEIKNDSSGIAYSNEKGCTTFGGNIHLDPVSQFGGLYIGYYLDQHVDYSLSGLGCPSPVNSHLFLALWGKSWLSPEPNVTALFCEPTYWSQEVNATVTVPGMDVSKVVPSGPQIPLPDSQFNRSAFEYIIGTGAQYVSQRADISRTTSNINQNASLVELGVNNTMTNMISFALGLSRLLPNNYTDPHNLASSLEKAHKLLHAIAVRQLMGPVSGNGQPRSSIVKITTNAIVVIRPLAITVEVLLALIVALALALLIQSHRRSNQLRKDPASITDVVSMMTKDLLLRKSITLTGAEKFQAQLVNGKILMCESEAASQNVQSNEYLDRRTQASSDMAQGHQSTPKIHRIRPTEMRMSVGFAFISLLILALFTVAVMKTYSDKQTGLQLPSQKALVNQLVLNYVPIAFAAILEPTWLLLNRLLCVLQPFEELRWANAKSTRSLNLKYNSLPPQLNVWRAFRGHHYLLSAVCAIGLSANLLALSLGGLFEIDFLPMEIMGNLTRRYEPTFSHVRRRPGVWDYQYVAKANISGGVVLPPWTVPDTFFVPFAPGVTSELGQVELTSAVTQGFGISANCDQSNFNDTAFITGEQNFFSTEQRTPGGRRVVCGSFMTPKGGQNNSNAALEVFGQLQPLDITQIDMGISTGINIAANATQEEFLTCNSILVAGFLRANLTVSFDDMKTDNTNMDPYPHIQRINSLTSLWMICRSMFITAPYDVTVDRSGYVQSYRSLGPHADDLSVYFPNGTNSTSLIAAANAILSDGADTIPYWHNDTFVDTWFAYYVKQLSNSTIFVDPTKPPPSFDSVVPYVEDIYTRLFAIVLSLNQHWLADANAEATISGTMIVPSRRVFISRPMFVITIALLALNIVVAITYWTRRPQKMLSAMPYTIASIMEMVQGSGLVTDVENEDEWEEHWRFGYGKFVGTDGKPHLGIERRPFVIPLDT